MHTVFQRHAVLAHIIDDVDAVHFGRTVGYTRSSLAQSFVGLNALYASLGIELINMVVAFMIFGR